MRRTSRWVRAGITALCVSCAPGERAADTTLVIGTTSEPDNLFPPLIGTGAGKQIADLLFERLAMPGPDATGIGDVGFTPELASAWSWSTDSLSIRFDIDPGARWHDGAPVRARDVAFAYSLFADPTVGSPSAADLAAVDSVTVEDSLTVTVWFRGRSYTQFNDAVVNLIAVPEHIWGSHPRATLRTDTLTRRPVGNGRFRFVEWSPDQHVILAASESHRRAPPRITRIVYRRASDDATNLARLIAGEVDALDIRTTDQLDRLANEPGVRVEFMPGFEYGYLLFNLHAGNTNAPHPVLGDRDVRRALAMAIDRATILANVYGALALPAYGPFVRAQFTADTTLPQLAFDPAHANALLDSLGWTRADASEPRRKGSRRLALSVIVPSSGGPRTAAAILLQEQWRQIGVTLTLDPVDRAGYADRVDRRHAFDLLLGQIRTVRSPSSLPQTWGTSGAASGGRNYAGYRSAAFDAHVDSGLRAIGVADARAQFRAAYATILDDMPAYFLQESRGALAINRRFSVPPLRGDGWWLDIPLWTARDPAARGGGAPTPR